jgi:hypothetical protein
MKAVQLAEMMVKLKDELMVVQLVGMKVAMWV